MTLGLNAILIKDFVPFVCHFNLTFLFLVEDFFTSRMSNVIST